jgi:hypothetical protein
MNECAPQCPTFPPSIAGPLAPIVVEWDDAGPTLDVTLYGTLGFSAQIITNPIYDSSAPPLAVINSINIYGNTLNIVFNAPSDVAQGYDAVIRVSNVCGVLDIPVHLDVIQPVTPPLTACDTAMALFPLDPRIPDVGDSLLAFTPAGCMALLPPNLLDVCAELQAFPLAAPAASDTVFGDQGGVCSQFAISDIIGLYDLCGALQAFPAAGPLTPADQFPVIQGGVCGLTTLADVSASVDICTLLQNLPNAVVQPTAVFYGQQGGACFEFAVADLLALVPPPVVAFPLLAPNGTCAAPSYSFAAFASSGMFYDPAGDGAVIIGDENCEDFISVGASVIAKSKDLAGNVGAQITLASATASFGGIITIKGGDASAGTSPGAIFIQAGHNTGAIAPANVEILAGDSTTFAGGNILIRGGFGAVEQGVVQIAGASNVFGISNLGFGWQGLNADWRINLTPGVAGDVITSNGPGLSPSWQTPSVSFPLLAPDGSCAAPSYSFTSDPTSGMFYDAGTGAVVIGDANCTDYIEIGASINILGGAGISPSNVLARGGDRTAQGALDTQGHSGIRGGDTLVNGRNAGAAYAQGGSAVAGAVMGGLLFAMGAVPPQTEGDFAVGGDILVAAGNSSAAATLHGDVIIATNLTAFDPTLRPDSLAWSATERLRILGQSGEWWLAGSPGVAGQALASQGPGLPPTWATVSAPLHGAATYFTAGAHPPFVVPAGVTTVYITGAGGGGGGGGGSSIAGPTFNGGGGAPSGEAVLKFAVVVVPAAVIPITIGSGGAGGIVGVGAGAGGPGGIGAPTMFGGLLVLSNAGTGGLGGSTAAPGAGGGAVFPGGQSGELSRAITSGFGHGGAGGSNIAGGIGGVNNTAAVGPGSTAVFGGGGCGGNAGSPGGAGGAGFLIIEW